jgi:hypothetical protein
VGDWGFEWQASRSSTAGAGEAEHWGARMGVTGSAFCDFWSGLGVMSRLMAGAKFDDFVGVVASILRSATPAASAPCWKNELCSPGTGFLSSV